MKDRFIIGDKASVQENQRYRELMACPHHARAMAGLEHGKVMRTIAALGEMRE